MRKKLTGRLSAPPLKRWLTLLSHSALLGGLQHHLDSHFVICNPMTPSLPAWCLLCIIHAGLSSLEQVVQRKQPDLYPVLCDPRCMLALVCTCAMELSCIRHVTLQGSTQLPAGVAKRSCCMTWCRWTSCLS